jgi:hypothetical protein
VGSKLDIAMAAPDAVPKCYPWEEWHQLHKNYTAFASVLFVGHAHHYTLCHSSSSKLYEATGAGALDKFHYYTKHKSMIDMKILSYMWLELAQNILYEYVRNPAEHRYRSSGMMATLIAITSCDKVTLYGFGTDEKDEYQHYFSVKKKQKEWSGHEYSAEKAFFAELERGHGKYLKHLKQYNLGQVKFRR